MKSAERMNERITCSILAGSRILGWTPKQYGVACALARARRDNQTESHTSENSPENELSCRLNDITNIEIGQWAHEIRKHQIFKREKKWTEKKSLTKWATKTKSFDFTGAHFFSLRVENDTHSLSVSVLTVSFLFVYWQNQL